MIMACLNGSGDDTVLAATMTCIGWRQTTTNVKYNSRRDIDNMKPVLINDGENNNSNNGVALQWA